MVLTETKESRTAGHGCPYGRHLTCAASNWTRCTRTNCYHRANSSPVPNYLRKTRTCDRRTAAVRLFKNATAATILKVAKVVWRILKDRYGGRRKEGIARARRDKGTNGRFRVKFAAAVHGSVSAPSIRGPTRRQQNGCIPYSADLPHRRRRVTSRTHKNTSRSATRIRTCSAANVATPCQRTAAKLTPNSQPPRDDVKIVVLTGAESARGETGPMWRRGAAALNPGAITTRPTTLLQDKSIHLDPTST